MQDWIKKEKNIIKLRIKANTQQKENKILGLIVDSTGQSYLHIGIKAIPQDNQANHAILHFLSKLLKYNNLKIHIGHKCKFKQIHILCSNTQEQMNLLQTLESLFIAKTA